MSGSRVPLVSSFHTLAVRGIVLASLAVACLGALGGAPALANPSAARTGLDPALASPIATSTATMFGLDSALPGDEQSTSAGNEPVTCTGCSPPLSYHGGVVLGSAAQAGEITVTPIYWAPGGAGSFPEGYVATIDRYVADIAAAGGQGTNVFAVSQEYYRASTGAGTGDQIKYSIGANASLTDTTAYPIGKAACAISAEQAAAGFTACVTDKSVREEVAKLIAEHAPKHAGLEYLYPVFFPPHVEIVDGGGQYSTGAWCGIHAAYTSAVVNAEGPVIYTEDLYPVSGCDGAQWPQYFEPTNPNKEKPGTADADSAVSTLSHEINEAVTDPQYNGSYGWYDSTGNEIGDDCSDIFGAPQGSTNTEDETYAQQSEFNQVINGHDYWTQESFSNATFGAFKTGQGCVQQAFQPQGSAQPTQPAPDLGTGVVSASPLDLPADGASSSTITETVSKQDGEPVVGDDVEFHVDTSNGASGMCGTLSGGSADTGKTPSVAVDAMTDENGQASVTYTSSTDDVSCDVTATDAKGGTTDAVTIHQGHEAEEEAATISTANLPTSLTAGAAAVTFTTTASNPSASELDGALQTIYVAGDDKGASGLDSSQVKLTYANDSTGGQSVSVPLTGTTLDDGVISGSTLPAEGTTLPAGEAETTTWQLSLAPGAPATAATGSQLQLETDLDQVDASSGATTNLAYDSGSSAVLATSSTPPVLTPTTVTTTVIEPTTTIIETVPASTSAAVRCTVPKLVGQSPAGTKARLKAASCTSATLIEPGHKKSQRLVVRSVSPKAGTRLPAGGEITVSFKAVSAKAARKAARRG